jgi:hypothetical protein
MVKMLSYQVARQVSVCCRCSSVISCWLKQEIFFHFYCCEGLSKSFWTESVTKYMSAFIIGHCCHHQSSPPLGLCGGSSFSATVRTCVGRSVNIPEFQRHPGNGTF